MTSKRKLERKVEDLEAERRENGEKWALVEWVAEVMEEDPEVVEYDIHEGFTIRGGSLSFTRLLKSCGGKWKKRE